MNLAQTMLSKGAAVLALSGPGAERIAFGSVAADCVVDRRQTAPQLAGIIDVTSQAGAVVWWPLDVLPYPTQGAALEDASEVTLSVRRAYHIGHSIELVCAVHDS